MSWWVKAPKSYTRIDIEINRDDIHGMLGDFKINPLPSGDIICTQVKPESEELNDLGTTLLNRPVKGHVIVTESLPC